MLFERTEILKPERKIRNFEGLIFYRKSPKSEVSNYFYLQLFYAVRLLWDLRKQSRKRADTCIRAPKIYIGD